MSSINEKVCGECGCETTARNTMGRDSAPLCGPCKRKQQWRNRLEKEADSMFCCGERMERIDCGTYECYECKTVKVA